MPPSDELDERELAHTALTPAKQGVPVGGDVPSQLQLVVIANGNVVTRTLPKGATSVIGRSERCEIAIDDESISRRHAVLAIGKAITIEDLGSSNGTHVRGERLAPNLPTPIAVGELVAIGNAHILVQQQSRPQLRPRRMWTHDDFEARLEEECAREKRSNAAFALLRIFADRRAPVRFVEEALVDLLRDSDVIGTYGPYQYQLLLPDTTPAQADEAVNRMITTLRARGLDCTIANACCPRDGRSPYQLAAALQAPAPPDKSAGQAAEDIVVRDPQMQSLHWLVEQIASSNIAVLLLGETGVGKEVFAQAIHRASPRAAGPFIEVNCAALTDTLLESELFGHEKGAFTHATAAKPGLIEAANGGTLLLDEIGEVPLATQVKLLRVLEGSQLRRVGALKSRPIDVRIVAATNADLETQVAAGTFRRDLYFRLNGAAIVIPPLRERLAEIEPLALAFIRRAWPHRDRPQPELAPETLELMKSYTWPGNVRELKNMIARAVVLCAGGTIRLEHLPAEKMRAMRITDTPPSGAVAWSGNEPGTGPTSTPPYATSTLVRARRGSAEEEQSIIEALERSGGNQTQAARLLGISRRTLVNRLNDYKHVFRPRKDRKS